MEKHARAVRGTYTPLTINNELALLHFQLTMPSPDDPWILFMG